MRSGGSRSRQLIGTLAASLLALAPGAAIAGGPTEPPATPEAASDELARAALTVLCEMPDAIEGRADDDGRRAAIDAALHALVELARSVSGPVASDGSLETELVLIGRDLDRDDSAVRRLRTRLRTPPEDLVDPSELPPPRALTRQRETMLRAAFSLTRDEILRLDAGERVDARLAWQAVLLIPSMVGESPGDARVGRSIAFDVLVRLDDPAAIPVIVEGMARDVERYGTWTNGSVHMQTASIAIARLAMSDGAVSRDDLKHLLTLIGAAETFAATSTDALQLVDGLITAFHDGRFTPPGPSVIEEGGGVIVHRPTIEQHAATFRQWASVLEAFPRDRLSGARQRLAGGMLKAARTRLAELATSSEPVGRCGRMPDHSCLEDEIHHAVVIDRSVEARPGPERSRYGEALPVAEPIRIVPGRLPGVLRPVG